MTYNVVRNFSTDCLIPPFIARVRSSMKQIRKTKEAKTRSSICILKKIKFALLSLIIVILVTSTLHVEAVTLKQVDKKLNPYQEAKAKDDPIRSTTSGRYWIAAFPIPVQYLFRDAIGRRIAIPTQGMLNLLSGDANFQGWTFTLSANPAPGEFRIIKWDIMKNLNGVVDGSFTLDYVSSDPNFPPAGQSLRWIQWVFTDWPSRFATDGRPTTTNAGRTFYRDGSVRNRPFYGANWYTSGDILNPGGGVTLRFIDEPLRTLNRMFVSWQADLFLVTWDNKVPGTVTFYDGIVYGFTIRRTCHDMGDDINGGVGGVTDEIGETIPPAPDVPGHFPVSVIDLTASPTQVPRQVGITLEVANQGCEVADFTVKVYADKDLPILGNGITIGQQSFYGVNAGENRSLYLTWDTSGVPENYYWISAEATFNGSSQIDYLIPPLWVGPIPPVGGISVPIAVSVGNTALLAPYIGLASTIIVATAATAIYVKRVKRRKEKQ